MLNVYWYVGVPISVPLFHEIAYNLIRAFGAKVVKRTRFKKFLRCDPSTVPCQRTLKGTRSKGFTSEIKMN